MEHLPKTKERVGQSPSYQAVNIYVRGVRFYVSTSAASENLTSLA